MHTSELYQLYEATEARFSQTKSMELKLVRAADSEAKQPVENTLWQPLILAPICFLTVWLIVVFIVNKLGKILHNKDKIMTSNCFKQVSCKNCRFFNNNHYLKCALHPATVSTKQALDCSDYWPH